MSSQNNEDKSIIFFPFFSIIVMVCAEVVMVWRLFTLEFWSKGFIACALYILMLPIFMILLGMAFFVVGMMFDFFLFSFINWILKRGRYS